MLAENLLYLRKRNRLTQEQVAAAVGVSRQALSKWETGESAPDIDNCIALANFYNVTLDDLVRYAPEGQLLPIPPKGKHFFGAVTVGENGVFRLPEKALEVFSIRSGEELLVLGEDGNGIALVKKDIFLQKID